MRDFTIMRGLVVAARVAVAICLGIVASDLAACGKYIADLPLVGLPADAPPRKQPGDYMPVHDLPPPREMGTMETAEQAKIRADLSAARDRQNAAGAAASK